MASATLVGSLQLGELFHRGRNSFSVLRLLLATAVILSHSFYLPGYGMDPLEQWTGLRLGGIAVDGFFALSGMLVTASLLRNPSVTSFIRHRLARLMPGFWVCLLFCALVLAPITVAVDKGMEQLLSADTIASLFGYVAKNATLLIVEPSLPNVLSSLDYRRINPCLWTLAPEACCYILLAAAGTLKLLRVRGRWLLALVFAAGLILVSGVFGGSAIVAVDGSLVRLVELGLNFLCGVLTVLFLPRLRLSAMLALALVLLYVACLSVDALQFLRVLVLAPALAALGRALPLHGRCDSLDISYGLYLYGSAIQQFLVWAGFIAAGAGTFFAISFLATAPLALLSWIIVERPALARWGHRSISRDAVPAVG